MSPVRIQTSAFRKLRYGGEDAEQGQLWAESGVLTKTKL
jgi:hypothetical protein